jgi:protein-arginine kinase activator protein McsA
MLCELCHTRDATVHLTQKAPGKEPRQRHLCQICFPSESMSDSEQAEAVLRFFQDERPGKPGKPK